MRGREGGGGREEGRREGGREGGRSLKQNRNMNYFGKEH